MTNRIPEDAGYYLDEYDGPRFWEHVSFHGGTEYLEDPLSKLGKDAGECWTWSGWDSQGYGRFNVFGRATPAHQLGFLEFGGKIPDSYKIDHLCRNLACVRHDHLEPVTQQVNVDRGKRGRANITHCRQNHEYTEANTKMATRNGSSFRLCVTCLKNRRRPKANA